MLAEAASQSAGERQFQASTGSVCPTNPGTLTAPLQIRHCLALLPQSSFFFNFIQFSGKIDINNKSRDACPLVGLGLLPLVNPGSAPENLQILFSKTFEKNGTELFECLCIRSFRSVAVVFVTTVIITVIVTALFIVQRHIIQHVVDQ